MAFELKEGQGSLFKNEKKDKETQPDYTGKCLINGELMQVSAWTKKPEGKKPLFSLSIKKYIKNEAQTKTEEDLPF